MFTFCISIEAQDKWFWQLFYALKSYEEFMPNSTPFNVIATIAVDEDSPHHVVEYKEILQEFEKKFPFFYWITHNPASELGYPRSYHKIAGPSLLHESKLWLYVHDNILVLDADVWLTKPFTKDYKIGPDEVRFWRAYGIAPSFESLMELPYAPEFIFEAGFREEELKDKWFEHSAYYMIHKNNFDEWFKEQKEIYRKIHPVLMHVENLKEKVPNYSPWFAEMHAATFTACKGSYKVKFFDDYFHCGNATKETYYFLCTFLHFFVAEDQVFWNKFWSWTFPFTDKEWLALENAYMGIPSDLMDRGLYLNSKYILYKILKYKDELNLFRRLRPINYDDLDTAPKTHNSISCPHCIQILEGK